MISVRIGFAVNDLQADDVSELIKELQPVLAAPRTDSWKLDASAATYLGPTASVVFAACLLMARINSQEASITLPTTPLALKAFCSFSGLQQLIERGVITITGTEHHARNETVPLQQFRRMKWGGSEPVIQLTRRHFPDLGTESEQLMRTCYSEIAQNIEDHAGSPIGGILCARYFHGTREIRIAIADLGVGIGRSLREAEKKTGIHVADDCDALHKVLSGNVSSKSRPNNMGQGISNLALIAQGNGGMLHIFSGSARATVTPVASTVQPLVASTFPGTLVALSLPVTGSDQDDDE